MNMNNLNDLLDKTFGNKQKIEKKKKSTRSYTRGKYFSDGDCVYLMVALNYAINAIKNKKDVVEKRENSTRYGYFKKWIEIREKLKKT